MAERIALVIGASRGLGLGLVKELAGRGWKVIATLRSAKTAAGLLTRIAARACDTDRCTMTESASTRSPLMRMSSLTTSAARNSANS